MKILVAFLCLGLLAACGDPLQECAAARYAVIAAQGVSSVADGYAAARPGDTKARDKAAALAAAAAAAQATQAQVCAAPAL